ncbi:hypothetical protein [Mesorhizobium helmanticense]|uniref:hypothetical protein n=1 Tax=Mesorhizobium helmanticense TaxID=1776423 RepID=UPI0011B28635|nr:hypothetical protein [Mesorhizobium helmanticense]
MCRHGALWGCALDVLVGLAGATRRGARVSATRLKRGKDRLTHRGNGVVGCAGDPRRVLLRHVGVVVNVFGEADHLLSK